MRRLQCRRLFTLQRRRRNNSELLLLLPRWRLCLSDRNDVANGSYAPLLKETLVHNNGRWRRIESLKASFAINILTDASVAYKGGDSVCGQVFRTRGATDTFPDVLFNSWTNLARETPVLTRNFWPVIGPPDRHFFSRFGLLFSAFIPNTKQLVSKFTTTGNIQLRNRRIWL